MEVAHASHTVPDSEAAEETWNTYSGGNGVVLLATSPAGCLLGFAHLAQCPPDDCCGAAEATTWGYLSDIYVAPAAAKNGLGKSLLSAAFAWARQEGLSELRWFCLSANEPAVRFYERLGFPPSGATVWQYP
eukprot:TRINITY_DN59149_c0_g1_i2.p2 TRINITY_DN59149_c0_g1~~TRINITY_DN59149_c0_g1_i2.p2  ORF type:complete len:132 (-),score=16.16 TRINITY_DN59149_c0_g1_i2:34-429(-)